MSTMSRSSFFPVLTVAALGAVSPALAADYYVDPGGDDAGAGTEQSPWRTLAKAAETAGAGDTVHIKSGTYAERLVPQNSGSDGAWITFTAYPGHTVTIDGQGVAIPYDPPWGGLVELSAKSYIRISGLEVRSSTAAGIFVWDSSSHVAIENNKTYDTFSSGIGIWGGNNIVVDGNEVELACNDGPEECITISGVDTFEIKNNEVHTGGPGNNGGEGIDAKEACRNGRIFGNRVHDLKGLGFYVDGWNANAGDIEVFANESYANGSGFAVCTENGGLLENTKIYGNVAHDNAGVGFWVAGWGSEGAAHPLRAIEVYGNVSRNNGDGMAVYGQVGAHFENVGLYDNVVHHNLTRGLWISGPDTLTAEPLMLDLWIVNNTFYGNGSGDWGGGITVDNLKAENLGLRNNILSNNLSFQIATGSNLDIGGVTGLTIDFNLIDGFRGTEGEIRGESYVEGDPLFAGAAGSDFHILEASPAVDAASAEQAPAVDFDGNPRPQGQGYDMGAFEYGLPPPVDAGAAGSGGGGGGGGGGAPAGQGPQDAESGCGCRIGAGQGGAEPYFMLLTMFAVGRKRRLGRRR